MPKLPRPFLRAHLLLNWLGFALSLSLLLIHPVTVLAAFPASQNYKLNEWSIGAGGSERGQSANYKTETIIDPTVAETGKSTNYQINPGLMGVEMANVPPAPAFTNPANYYNKLSLIINTGNNPSDTTYAVAISPDNFITTYYVKADNTISATLTASDWRDYASWGGASGINVLGLSSSTTYSVKVKAEQGDFTESGWGPLASAATAASSITFDIDVAASDTETAAPYTVALGTLSPGSVTTSTDKVWTDFSTNADNGGVVYVSGINSGLKSTAANHTIPGMSANLSGQTEGYGVRVATITQTSGGPFTADAPFNGAGDIVGSTGTTLIPLSTSLAPLVGGRNSVDVKTVINSLTPSASDYTETLTLVAAGTF